MSGSPEFWSGHPGLVWSNRGADDSARIRAALLAPRFHQLYAIAERFGLSRLEAEWHELSTSDLDAARWARPIVERILRNLRAGFESAST